jgi:transcriptional regulator with XRE-family HTH domain
MRAKNEIKAEKDWIEVIARKIKLLRKQNGYTSYENFALDHGLDRKQYWRAETGSNLTIKSLVKILKIHKIDLKSFFIDL